MLRKMTQSGQRRAVAILFILLTVLGLWLGADYGMPWDEPLEIEILRTNLKEYALRLGLDEAVAYYDDMGIKAVSETPDRDHGEAAYYPVAGLLLLDAVSPQTRMQLWHGYTFLWFMLGVWALYTLVLQLTGKRLPGVVAALTLYLTPRMFAEGHYNNKDMLLLSLTLCVLSLGLRLMREPRLRTGVLFALCGALATNIKIAGVWPFGLMGLCIIAHLAADQRFSTRVWGLGAAILALFVGFFILLTPATWADPLGYLPYVLGMATAFKGWDNDLLFRGMVFRYSVNPLPFYYLPYMMLVTTPLWILALAVVGQLDTAVQAIRERKRLLRDRAVLMRAACTLFWVLPLLFAMLRRVNIFNGWRHFYFLYAGVLVMAAFGVQAIGTRLRGKAARRVGAGLLAACMLATGAQSLFNHPYQYAYFNPLVSGRDVENEFEIDYWNVSARNVLWELLQSAEGAIEISGVDVWSQYGLEISVASLPARDRERIVLGDYQKGVSEYALVNRSYQNLSGWDAEGYAPLLSSKAYGRVLMSVYRREALP